MEIVLFFLGNLFIANNMLIAPMELIMRLTKSAVAITIAFVLLSACTTIPSATPKGPRTIILHGKQFSEEEVGSFMSWRCVDYVYGGKTLIEAGTFSNTYLADIGFVLYDGGEVV